MKNLLTLTFIVVSLFSFSQAPPRLTEWVGTYKGKMYLGYTEGIKDSLDIIIEILPTEKEGVWTHRYTFTSPKYNKIIKDYLLVWDAQYVDGKHFYEDEQNGIKIDQVLIGDSFYGNYEVLKGDYITILTRTETGLDYKIICSKKEGGRDTASSDEGSDEKFIVLSSMVFTVQFARLEKID